MLWQGDREYLNRLRQLDCPNSVPWEFVAERAEQCFTNHSQDPETLARRGGLAPAEIVAVYEGHANWDERRKCWGMTAEEEVKRLRELLMEWNSKQELTGT